MADKITKAADFRTGSREWKDQFRNLFIEIGDPTGYVFAEQYVEGGYRSWKKIANSFDAKSEIGEWMETLSVRLQAEAILNIAKNRESFQANKWLADRGWDEKEDKRTKEAKKRAAEVDQFIKNDMERLGLIQ